jgi:hypothetical protein
MLLALSIFHCSTTHESADLFPPIDLIPVIFEYTQEPAPEILFPYTDTITSWTPRFISTGISTGIMVEFTGFRTDKPVNAKYSYLEFGETDNDSTFLQTRSQINDLRQAFFSLPPGRYIIRHITPWAEQRFIGNVMVRDEEYSIITVNVLVPPVSR